MTMRGRPPTPTNIRELRGNPGKRPMNKNEPKPRQLRRMPKPPDILDEVGQKEWRLLGPVLMRYGLLTILDLTAFLMYCSTYERWVYAVREAKRIPLITTPGGVIKMNPLAAEANRLSHMLHISLSRFGLDPASRSRIAVDPADREDDELAKWLFGS